MNSDAQAGGPDTEGPIDEILDDDALAEASGGQTDNSVEIVYSSTFVPFDSSF